MQLRTIMLTLILFLVDHIFLVRAFRPANVSFPTGMILSGGRMNPPWELVLGRSSTQ